MRIFFQELKNRRVFRVALGYAIVASGVVQVIGTVFPIFHVQDWVQQVFVVFGRTRATETTSPGHRTRRDANIQATPNALSPSALAVHAPFFLQMAGVTMRAARFSRPRWKSCSPKNKPTQQIFASDV
jgi:hypothetical protein